MKFCIECEHHRVEYHTHRCYAPQNGVDLVTGQSIDRSCAVQRSPSTFSPLPGYCGEEGLFFKLCEVSKQT